MRFRSHASSRAAPARRSAVGGLVTGEQDQRGLVVAVVKRPLQGREVLQQLGAQPVDRPGAIGHQISAPGGQDAQLHGDLITGTQRLQVAAHPGLIGDHRGVFGVGLTVAAIPARCVIDGAARDVEQPLGGGQEQGDQQRGPAAAEIDRPGELATVGQRRDCVDQLPQCRLIVGDPPRQQPLPINVDDHAMVV